MQRKVRALGSLFFCFSLLSTHGISAPGSGYPMGPALRQMMNQVELTKEQREKIKELRQARQVDMKNLKVQMEQCRQDLKTKVSEGASSEVLTQSFNKLKDAKNAMEEAHFNMFLKTFEILSAEQRKMILQKLNAQPSGPTPAMGDEPGNKNTDLP